MSSMDRKDVSHGCRRAWRRGASGRVRSSSGSGSSGCLVDHAAPAISKESGNLSILEWDGYQAFGTPTNKKAGGLSAGDGVHEEVRCRRHHLQPDRERQRGAEQGPARGSNSTSSTPASRTSRTTSTTASCSPGTRRFCPASRTSTRRSCAAARCNGQQYFIPWDWGYGSVIYRTDKVDPADAKGWELFWNPKYKDRISMWNGNTTNFEIAALKLGYGGKAMDHLIRRPADECQEHADRAVPAEQVPLVERVHRPPAGAPERRHLDRLQLAGPVGVRQGQGDPDGVHAAQPGPARLVLRVHARQGHARTTTTPTTTSSPTSTTSRASA